MATWHMQFRMRATANFKNLCKTFFTPAEIEKSLNLWLPFVFISLF